MNLSTQEEVHIPNVRLEWRDDSKAASSSAGSQAGADREIAGFTNHKVGD